MGSLNAYHPGTQGQFGYTEQMAALHLIAAVAPSDG